MFRRLPLVVALLVLFAACQGEAPPEEPAADPVAAAPEKTVEPPPVVPNSPGDAAVGESVAVSPPPEPEVGKKPDQPEAEPKKEAEAPAPKPIAPGTDRVRDFVDQLADSDNGKRFQAAVELGRTNDLTAVGPLVTTLEEDTDYFVRRAAARSLGELGSDEAVPALIDALEDKEVFVQLSAKQALKRISGKTFETKADWDAWWKEQQKK